MSLVYGFPNTKGVKVSDYLSAQGITLLRCTLSSFEAVVTVSRNQPAYKAYTNFLPAYMAAFCTQSRTSVLNPYHPLKYESTKELITDTLPPLSVSFANIPDSAFVDAMRGEGAKELEVKGRKIFLIPNPTPDLIRRMLENGANRATPAATDSANIDALATLKLIRRIFSNFFLTHQYPAFNDSDHLEYMDAHWKTAGGSDKRKATGQPSQEPASKRIQPNPDEDAEMSPAEDRMTSVPDEGEAPISEKILWALPPPPVVVAWGDELDVPDGDGVWVRYIEETQNSKEEKIISDVIARYFIGCLGTNADAVRTMFARIKSDLGVLKFTSVGRELAHMAKCIDIGLQAQARLFPIVSLGQYLGCCLMGAGFQIHAYGETVSPVASAALQKLLERSGSHRSSLSAIADIVDNDPDEVIHQAVLSCPSIVMLRNGLIDCPLTNDQRDQICALAKGLRFKTKSLNISPDNLTMCLDLIHNPGKPLPIDLPIHPSCLFEMDRISLVWSSFGELAPTFNFPGGAQVDLTTVKDLPHHVGCRNIALKDATIDLQVILQSKRFANCTNSKRSGPHKDRLYTRLDCQKILTGLCDAAGVARSSKGKERAGNVGNVDTAILDEGF